MKFLSSVADIALGLNAYEPQTLVSVQSVSLGALTRRHLPGILHFEDRNFYLADFLRYQGNHVVFVVSNDPDVEFVRHHLKIVAQCLGMGMALLCKKVTFLRIPSHGSSSLTQRLLEDPEQYMRLEAAIRQARRPFLDFWVVSELEIELAKRLKLPYFGPPADALGWDSKSSARKIFAEAKIAHPRGQEDLSSFAEVQHALQNLSAKSKARSFLIKLNNEEAANGIGQIDRGAIGFSEKDFRAALTISKDIPLAEFEARLSDDGCALEEFIQYSQVANPSVKMCITRDGKVLNLATHDQILTDMTYSGSIFPANGSYRQQLIRSGFQIAKLLLARGVRGIFSVDFLAGRDSGDVDWSLWALEINIRKGATTHPYFWTRLLTSAHYDESAGVLRDPVGEIVYISSEYIHSNSLRCSTPAELIWALLEAGIEFNPNTRSGVFIHMATSMREYSKVGATIIAPDHKQAFDLFDQLKIVVGHLVT